MIAAIYARKSPVQNGGAGMTTSVTRQVEHARAYADRKGWTVADDQIYLDDRISGAEFENRPGYMRLLNALKPQAPFEVLIVSELSRLGREQFETNYALKQLSQAGVRVYSHLEDREVLLDTPTETHFHDRRGHRRRRCRGHADPAKHALGQPIFGSRHRGAHRGRGGCAGSRTGLPEAGAGREQRSAARRPGLSRIER